MCEDESSGSQLKRAFEQGAQTRFYSSYTAFGEAFIANIRISITNKNHMELFIMKIAQAAFKIGMQSRVIGHDRVSHDLFVKARFNKIACSIKDCTSISICFKGSLQLVMGCRQSVAK